MEFSSALGSLKKCYTMVQIMNESKNKISLKIGGVPENVNIPWYETLEGRDDVTWRDCPGGTGEMCRLLDEGEVDIALVLTEGAISHIAKGSKIRIAGTYVQSPLTWGVHTSPSYIAGESGSRFAVSRMGSGSHLMSYVYASQKGWLEKQAPEIVVCGGIDGAMVAFEEGKVDLFLWEKFMTKPLVDAGRLGRIDLCRGPWPAFSIAVGEHVAHEQLEHLVAQVSATLERLGRENFIEKVIQRYGLLKEDVEEWFGETEFACSLEVNIEALKTCAAFLEKVGILETPFSPINALTPFLRDKLNT